MPMHDVGALRRAPDVGQGHAKRELLLCCPEAWIPTWWTGGLPTFPKSEVSKRGWREGVGDQQRPKYSNNVSQNSVLLLLRGHSKKDRKRPEIYVWEGFPCANPLCPPTPFRNFWQRFVVSLLAFTPTCMGTQRPSHDEKNALLFCRGAKKHIKLLQHKLFGPHPKHSILGPRKKFMCLISWERFGWPTSHPMMPEIRQSPDLTIEKKGPIHISPANRFIHPMWAPDSMLICLFFPTEKRLNPQQQGGKCIDRFVAICESAPFGGQSGWATVEKCLLWRSRMSGCVMISGTVFCLSSSRCTPWHETNT